MPALEQVGKGRLKKTAGARSDTPSCHVGRGRSSYDSNEGELPVCAAQREPMPLSPTTIGTAMDISPYIFFSGGKCREAFTFYQQVFGGELMMITGADMPSSDAPPPEMAELIMHAALRAEGQVLMGSDDPTGDDGPKKGMTVSFSDESVERVEKAFSALSEGGEITMPLAATSWALSFGMCVDRFGTPWMLSAESPDR
ncbi:MAG TPA: VOC family protein [Microthrixaceae bacterium]|nr:VOC family protein [Microthrixaceae bacterium]